MKHIIIVLSLIITTTSHLYAQCNAVCTPLAYEGFEYDELSPLDELSGGSGWGNIWEVQGSDTSIPGYHVSANDNLGYDDLQTFGGGLSGGNSWLSAGRALDLSEDGLFNNYLDNGFIGAENTTLYFSAIIRKDENNSDPMFINLHEGNIPWYDEFDSPQLTGFGYYGNASNENGTDYWTLRIFDDYYLSDIPVVVGEDVLFVLAVTFGTNDMNTYDWWVNPATIGSNMPSPSLTQTINGEMRFRSLKLYHGSGTEFGIMDEIRFSESWNCAVPDSNTPLNRVPVAEITTTTLSGMGPLVVDFDASNSYDPDINGDIISYEWDFGDGQTASGAIVSNTYIHTGQMTATLTLTDNCGSTFSEIITITVLDENGEFPCLSTIRLDQMADFEVANGAFFVEGGTDYTLTLPDNSQINQSNGHFTNLAAGQYALEVMGQGGCTETFEITIPTDSTSIENWTPDICNFHIGMNIDGIPYWNQIRAFKDFAMQADDYFTGPVEGGVWNSGYMNEVAVDNQGYPLELPYSPSDGGGEQLVRGVISADGHMLLGDYVLLYDGEGVVTLFGDVQEMGNIPGRIEFSVIGQGNIWYHIQQSTLGNHVRNVRIVRVEDEADFETAPFYVPFLEKLNEFEAIRFMDWGHTNGSEQIAWSDRKLPDYHTQGHGHAGVAYEWMIELANLMQKDIWICVPHQADDDYITQMALLFREQLDENITIYLEYSNEVWNWQFSQAHWVNDRKPANWSQQRYYAERSGNVFRIWHDVFANDANRVKRVLATQTVNPWLGQQAMSQLKGEFDYLSPTWYFGYASDICQSQLEALGANATAEDVLACTRQNFLAQAGALRQQHMNAKLYGKEVIEYEGGQHMTSNPAAVSFQQAVYDAQVHPGIYDLYQEVMDSLRIWDSKLAMAFTLSSVRESIYGSWGALEYIEQDPMVTSAPKWDALIDNILCYEPAVDFSTDIAYIPDHSMNIHLFPNPTSGILHMEWEVSALENLRIDIHNILGQSIASHIIQSPDTKYSLDLSQMGLRNGTYIIHLSQGGQTLGTDKIILMQSE